MLPPIPGLSATKQAFLDVIVDEAITRGEWEFPFAANEWCRRMTIKQPHRRLDAATEVLCKHGLITLVAEARVDPSLQPGPRRSPRIWRVNPGAIRAAIEGHKPGKAR